MIARARPQAIAGGTRSRNADASDSFGKAQEYTRLAAEEYARKAEVSPEGDWSYILNYGFRGLARTP